MNTQQRRAPIGAPVLALHCSGADSRQWDKLAQLLDPTFSLIGVDLYGTRATGHWPGATPFAIEADAQLALAVLDRLDGPVHLLGHSYGGAVALNVALQRAGRIASVSLYEPSSFHVLKQLGQAGSPALNEIMALANAAAAGVLSGDYVEAAQVFIDYWNGPGAWRGMKAEVRDALLAWFAKAPLDFRAALGDQTLVMDYRRLTCPVLIMRGEQALAPSRMIAEALDGVLLDSTFAVVPGAGHMGPLTDAKPVNALIAAHLTRVGAAAHDLARAA